MQHRRGFMGFGVLAGAAVLAGLPDPAWACGPKKMIPMLGDRLTEAAVAAHPSAEVRATIAVLVHEMRKAQAEGRDKDARAAEEQAMKLLGYRKVWLRCGPGTFVWMKAKIA